MPIIDVEMVYQEGEAMPEGLASTLADAIGEVFGADPGRVWVRVRTLPDSQYAENLSEAPRPVFVTVLAAQPPAGDLLRLQADQITQAVARICRYAPENVHVLFEPPAAGRIAFGGVLR